MNISIKNSDSFLSRRKNNISSTLACRLLLLAAFKRCKDYGLITLLRWLLIAVLVLPIFVTVLVPKFVTEVEAIEAVVLPELGDSMAGLMPPAQERALGQAWLKSFRAGVPLEQDPLLFEYLENLLLRLASNSDLSDKRLDLVVVKNPTINAFAVPGGVVGINTGLLRYAQDEAQLSSVLTHELAHLSQRHFARSVEASKRANITSIVGLLAGIAVAAAGGGGNVATAAIMTSQAAALDSRLRYSRLHEREADRLGTQTLVRAGYPAQAAAEMFKQMLNTSRLYGNRTPEFLRTHPITESRVADASNRARQLPPIVRQPSIDYLLMRTRVIVHAGSSAKNNIKHFKLQLKNVGKNDSHGSSPKQKSKSYHRDAALYGLAMSYNQNGQWKKARRTLAPLLKQQPARIPYSLLDIEIDIEAGELKLAEKRLSDLNALIPKNYPISMLLAKTLRQNKEYKSAQLVLQSLAETRPKQADIWYMLAETHGLASDILKLHQARAEFFLLRGNFTQARKHLHYALNLAQNNYHVSARIKERVREINVIQHTMKNL